MLTLRFAGKARFGGIGELFAVYRNHALGPLSLAADEGGGGQDGRIFIGASANEVPRLASRATTNWNAFSTSLPALRAMYSPFSGFILPSSTPRICPLHFVVLTTIFTDCTKSGS